VACTVQAAVGFGEDRKEERIPAVAAAACWDTVGMDTTALAGPDPHSIAEEDTAAEDTVVGDTVEEGNVEEGNAEGCKAGLDRAAAEEDTAGSAGGILAAADWAGRAERHIRRVL